MKKIKKRGSHTIKLLFVDLNMHKFLSLILLIGLAILGCEDNDECIDESKISDHYICTEEYQPVCGCNGFMTMIVMLKMQVSQNGLKVSVNKKPKLYQIAPFLYNFGEITSRD